MQSTLKNKNEPRKNMTKLDDAKTFFGYEKAGEVLKTASQSGRSTREGRQAVTSPSDMFISKRTVNGPTEEDAKNLRRDVVGVTLTRAEWFSCLVLYLTAMGTLIFLFEMIKPSQLFTDG